MKVIELNGVVGLDITNKYLKNRLPKDGSDVLLKVDSPGGSVYEGNRLYNTILDYKGVIKVELGALAASAASYFPLAAGKENISVRENTIFMGHKAWLVTWGNADELQKNVEILSGMDKIIAKAYNKLTGKPIDEILEEMKNEFWLMSGQEVVDSGFASAITDSSEEESEDENDVYDKTEVLALIDDAYNRLKQANIEEDNEKWAAMIGSVLKEEPKTQLQGLKNIKEVSNNMGLEEMLGKDPEAKAEYDKNIADAKAGVNGAVDKDRERFAKVLKLSGVNISDDILNKAKAMSIEEFAINELEERNSALAKIEKADLGGLKPENQMPKKAKETENKTENKKIDNALDDFFGKKEAK